MDANLPPPMPPLQPQPPMTAPPGSNWWGRNWKWFAPVGCVGALLLIGAFVALIMTLVFSAIKSSDAYKVALARAEADPQVAEALGTPLKPGTFVLGSIKVNGAGGHADLAIPVTGPKGEGTIYAVAAKVIGEWKFSSLIVLVKASGERIDLTEKKAPRSW